MSTNLIVPFTTSPLHALVHLVPDHLLTLLETLRVLPHRHRRRRYLLVRRLNRMSTGRHLCPGERMRSTTTQLFPAAESAVLLSVCRFLRACDLHNFQNSTVRTLPQRSSAFTGSASQNVSTSNWQLWRIHPSTTPLRPNYSRVSDMTSRRRLRYLTSHHIVWTLHPLVSQQSASGRFRFLVPPFGTTCLSTSHLRRQSRFSDNDSRPFCFPVPTKTLSYDSCVTITIHHYCLDIRGPCNN